MFKTGFRFKVVKNGLIGVIDGVNPNPRIYSVMFLEDGHPYLRADVHEKTIEDNLRLGIYEEV